MRPCRRGHNDRGPDGACRVCKKASKAAFNAAHPNYQRNWYKANNHSARASRIRCYNITLQEYEDQFAKQGGVCAICKKPETVMEKKSTEPKKLAVDHDHKTNVVRGLLCVRCNHGVGLFLDSPELLEAAAIYLREAVNIVERYGKLEPRRRVNKNKPDCFELRKCCVCSQVVAHRLEDGMPHGLHVTGRRHQKALEKTVAAEAEVHPKTT